MLYDIKVIVYNEPITTVQAVSLTGIVKTIRNNDLIDITSLVINGIMIHCNQLTRFNSVELRKAYLNKGGTLCK